MTHWWDPNILDQSGPGSDCEEEVIPDAVQYSSPDTLYSDPPLTFYGPVWLKLSFTPNVLYLKHWEKKQK